MTKEIKGQPKTEVQASPLPKFSVEKMRDNCLQLFGIATSTFDGATFGLNGEYSVADMKNIISKWNSKEAK